MSLAADSPSTGLPSLSPGDAAKLLAKLGDSSVLPPSTTEALRQQAAEDVATHLLSSSSPGSVSGNATPTKFRTPIDTQRENDRVTAVVDLTHDALRVVSAESNARRHAEERALKAESDALSARNDAVQAHLSADQARNSRTWRFFWWLSVSVLGLALLVYVIGGVLASFREPSPLLMDVRFINPSDGSRVPKPKSETDMGSFASSSIDDDNNNPQTIGRVRWVSNVVLWPYQWWTRERYREEREQNAVVVYPLVDSINTEECILVTPEEARSGKMFGGRVPLIEVRTSLLYHLASKRITAACAQHIGVPACYCILDMRMHPDGGKANLTYAGSKSFMDLFQPGDYLEVFNPNIIGFSRNRILQVQEKNVFCQKPYFTKRFEAITVEFLDASGNIWERDFRSVHSFNLQHAAEIHRGIRSCLDNSADLLMQILRGRIGGSNERPAFERQMLFSDPESHRNYRPPLPSPGPVAALPKISSITPNDNSDRSPKDL